MDDLITGYLGCSSDIMEMLIGYSQIYSDAVDNIQAAFTGEPIEFFAPSKLFSVMAFHSVFDNRYRSLLDYLDGCGLSDQIPKIIGLFEPRLLPATPIKDIRDYFSHAYVLDDGDFKIDTTGLCINNWEWLYIMDMLYVLTDVIALLAELYSTNP